MCGPHAGGSGGCSGNRPGFRSAPRSLSTIHATGDNVSSGAGSSQRSRNVRSSAPTTGPCSRNWTSCQGGCWPYCSAICTACGSPWCDVVVSPRVAQIDATGEGDVALGCSRMPDHDQLLMVRSADPDTLIQQHFTTRPLDRLTEMLVLLLAVGELVQMRTPHQTLYGDAPFCCAAEQLADTRPVFPHLLVRIAAPVREEEVVACAQRLDLVDEVVEVRRTVNQGLCPIALTPGRQARCRVAAFGIVEEPL